MVNRILVVPKMTKLEFDMRHYGISEEKLLKLYKKHGLDPNLVLESHKRQEHNLDRLKSAMYKGTIIARDNLTKKIAEKYDLVIAFGGDNHFQYVAHFLDKTPILGINSDPELSDGALLNDLDFEVLFEKIKSKGFRTEKWPRLEATVGNEKIKEKAVSEIYVGEALRVLMSRHILQYKGKKEMQKGSGLIISTGIGSRGWFGSASAFLKKGGLTFPPEKEVARFILAEPKRRSNFRMNHGILRKGQALKIKSLNRSHGVVTIDSWNTYDVYEGEAVGIRLSEPLKVARI